MGENFLRKQAQSFQRQWDKAHHTHIQTPNLFTDKNESVKREFAVSCGLSGQAGGQMLTAGEWVIVCASPEEGAYILRGNRRFDGFSSSDQTDLQTTFASHPDLGGMLKMQITNVSPLGDITLTSVVDAVKGVDINQKSI